MYEKSVACVLAVVLCVGMLPGCAKQALPVPEYPVEPDGLQAALEEVGLDWTLEAQEDIAEGWTSYSLYKDEKFMVIVATLALEEERFLQMWLPAHINNSNKVPREECESVLLLAAHLFGDFTDERSLYNAFMEEYGVRNTEQQEGPQNLDGRGLEQRSVWEREVEGIHCRVDVGRPYRSTPEENLSGIMTTSWAAFMREE